MNKPIKTYQDLVEEKERLEILLHNQKELVRTSAHSLKSEFKPAFAAFSFLGTLVSRDSTNPVLGATANTMIDIVLKKLILGRAGWIARTLLPILVKNMSSHYIHDHENDIFKRIFSFFGFGKKKKKSKMEEPHGNGQEIIN